MHRGDFQARVQNPLPRIDIQRARPESPFMSAAKKPSDGEKLLLVTRHSGCWLFGPGTKSRSGTDFVRSIVLD